MQLRCDVDEAAWALINTVVSVLNETILVEVMIFVAFQDDYIVSDMVLFVTDVTLFGVIELRLIVESLTYPFHLITKHSKSSYKMFCQ